MDLKYEEVCDQPYINCRFSAGFVTGHPDDTIYLRIERSEDISNPLDILMRPDEAAAIIWVLSGTLWSDAVKMLQMRETFKQSDCPIDIQVRAPFITRPFQETDDETEDSNFSGNEGSG